MKERARNITLGSVATLVAILAGGYQLWPVIGWMTPAGHAADIEDLHASNSAEAAVEAVKLLRDEWKCDEWDEELLELRKERAATESDARRVEIDHQVDKIEKKMAATECNRFEDFG